MKYLSIFYKIFFSFLIKRIYFFNIEKKYLPFILKILFPSLQIYLKRIFAFKIRISKIKNFLSIQDKVPHSCH